MGALVGARASARDCLANDRDVFLGESNVVPGGSKRARRPKHTRSLTTARHVSEVLELAICDKDSSVVRIKPLYVTCSTRPIIINH